MRLFVAPVSLLYRHRHMLLATSWNDIRTRFAGSVLGLAWLVLYPLLLLSAYAAVYVYIFHVKVSGFSSPEYVALIFCGLIPFLGFSEALGLGTPSVTSNSHLLKNTLFPIDLIPAKAVLASQATQVAGMGLLLVALLLLQRLSPWSLLFLPLWACQLAFTVGLVWVFSGLNVYFRDLQNLVALLTMVLMMVSPIAYTESMVPDALRPFLRLNPLYYFIIAYQQCLMEGHCPRWTILAPVLLLGVLPMALGYAFFSRLKTLFSDNV